MITSDVYRSIAAGATADVNISIPYDDEFNGFTIWPEHVRSKIGIKKVSFADRVLTVQVHNHSAENLEVRFAITRLRKRS